MSIKYALIEVGGTMQAIIAYGVEDEKVLPVGVMTFEQGEIGSIHVVENFRRQGIATNMLKHGDAVAGTTLIDDGIRSHDGSKLISALGRPKAPFVKRAAKHEVLRAIRGITWNYLFAPANKMNELKL